jgi:nucleotide-binding universal stress UspA family protein
VLKDILVHIDSSKECGIRLKTAIGLARECEAHLTGLYVVQEFPIPGYVRAQIRQELLDATAAARRAESKEVEKTFNDECKRAGIKGEWRYAEGDVPQELALHARYADIAIVGQRNPENPSSEIDEMPDRFIMSVGRPVLVVPYVGNYPTVGKDVLVSWDTSRLASRAVNDALPFLKTAKKVHVLAVNPAGGSEGHGDIPCADICLHLARHGVKAEASSLRAEDLDVGDAILSRAADFGVDMIVMGAYGHARWRELVLGGATRHILEHMTVPVLMSH